jgi:hypothetical protein
VILSDVLRKGRLRAFDTGRVDLDALADKEIPRCFRAVLPVVTCSSFPASSCRRWSVKMPLVSRSFYGRSADLTCVALSNFTATLL